MKFPEIESSYTASLSTQTKKTKNTLPPLQKKKNRKEKIGYAIAIN